MAKVLHNSSLLKVINLIIMLDLRLKMHLNIHLHNLKISLENLIKRERRRSWPNLNKESINILKGQITKENHDIEDVNNKDYLS